jgi:hypothetical protein
MLNSYIEKRGKVKYEQHSLVLNGHRYGTFDFPKQGWYKGEFVSGKRHGRVSLQSPPPILSSSLPFGPRLTSLDHLHLLFFFFVFRGRWSSSPNCVGLPCTSLSCAFRNGCFLFFLTTANLSFWVAWQTTDFVFLGNLEVPRKYLFRILE